MKTICIDFDGVIYPNLKYHGTTILSGEPVAGAISALHELSKQYIIIIHSSRCSTDEGVKAISDYLILYGMSYAVATCKPNAHIYLDDRAVKFDGDWGKAQRDIEEFVQWQRDQKAMGKILRKRRRSSRVW